MNVVIGLKNCRGYSQIFNTYMWWFLNKRTQYGLKKYLRTLYPGNQPNIYMRMNFLPQSRYHRSCMAESHTALQNKNRLNALTLWWTAPRLRRSSRLNQVKSQLFYSILLTHNNFILGWYSLTFIFNLFSLTRNCVWFILHTLFGVSFILFMLKLSAGKQFIFSTT